MSRLDDALDHLDAKERAMKYEADWQRGYDAAFAQRMTGATTKQGYMSGAGYIDGYYSGWQAAERNIARN